MKMGEYILLVANIHLCGIFLMHGNGMKMMLKNKTEQEHGITGVSKCFTGF